VRADAVEPWVDPARYGRAIPEEDCRHRSVTGLYACIRASARPKPPLIPIISVPVHAGVLPYCTKGLSAMGTHCSPAASRIAPDRRGASLSVPPQRIADVPVQTKLAPRRGVGAPAVAIGVQESVTGSYCAPSPNKPFSEAPPQTNIREPVQTADADCRPAGAPLSVMRCQASVTGSYR